jgi:hypothetical protein
MEDTLAVTFDVMARHATNISGITSVTVTTSALTATAGVDYTETVTTVSFLPGETTRPATVPVLNDAIVEPDETFSATLSDAIMDGVLDSGFLGISSATGTTVNDDMATITLVPATSNLEGSTTGSTTPFAFDVILSNPVQGGFSLAFTTDDGTATAISGDYLDNDSSLSFLRTAETQIITVFVNHDLTVEADETFSVTLGALTGLAIGINPSAVTVAILPETATILNDDTATITLVGPASALECSTSGSTTPFTFDVVLSAPVQGGFNVAFTTDDGTATAISGDYVDNDGSLSFLGTAETQIITVLVNHDLTVEADETFTVSLAPTLTGLLGISPTAITLIGTPQTATILNDDAATQRRCLSRFL